MWHLYYLIFKIRSWIFLTISDLDRTYLSIKITFAPFAEKYKNTMPYPLGHGRQNLQESLWSSQNRQGGLWLTSTALLGRVTWGPPFKYTQPLHICLSKTTYTQHPPITAVELLCPVCSDSMRVVFINTRNLLLSNFDLVLIIQPSSVPSLHPQQLLFYVQTFFFLVSTQHIVHKIHTFLLQMMGSLYGQVIFHCTPHFLFI